MSHYPSLEELTSREDKELFRARRSIRSIFSNLFLFFFLLFLAVLIIWLFPNGFKFPLTGEISSRWVGIVPLLVLLEVVRKYHDDIYVFQRHGMIHYEGRLSLYSSTPALKYADILSVRVKQDIWGRILDYGSVELDSAGTTGVEVTMVGVRSPSELASLIEALRIESIRKGTVDSPQN